MAKLSTGSGGKKAPIIQPDGYDCYCYGSVEMGTQDGEFEGVPNMAKKIKLFFEIPELQITYERDGVEVQAPQVINIEYTNSAGNKAKIKPVLEAWLGMDIGLIDLATDLVGKPARISVINKTAKSSGNVYAAITNIGKCKEKDIKDLPPMHNKPLVFSVMDHGFDSPQFKALEDRYRWIQDDIKKSHEYKEYLAGPKGQQAATESTASNIDPSDIPF